MIHFQFPLSFFFFFFLLCFNVFDLLCWLRIACVVKLRCSAFIALREPRASRTVGYMRNQVIGAEEIWGIREKRDKKSVLEEHLVRVEYIHCYGTESQMNQDQQLSLKIKYLKLKRVNGLNNKLRDELSRERITASNACLSIVNYVSAHRDYAIPEIWGYPNPGTNHFRDGQRLRLRQSPGRAHGSSKDPICCAIM